MRYVNERVIEMINRFLTGYNKKKKKKTVQLEKKLSFLIVASVLIVRELV